MAKSTVDRNGQAYARLQNRLLELRGVNEAPGSALPVDNGGVVEALAPIFPRHEKIVLGLLGDLKPDSTLRSLAVSHGLEQFESLALTGAKDAAEDQQAQILNVQSRPGASPSVASTSTSIPTSTAARDEAIDFRRQLFALEPTGVLQRMVMDNHVGPFPNDRVRESVSKFIENQPQSFDIRHTPVPSALRRPNAFDGIPPEDHSGVSTAIRSLQTAQSMTDDPEAIKPLREAGLSTAFAVSSMSESAFLSATRGKIDHASAQQIHRRALDSRIRNDHALVSLLQTARGTGIAAIDGNSTLEDRKKALGNKLRSAIYGSCRGGKDCDGRCPDHGRDDVEPDEEINPAPVVDLESLFGSLDYCACSDCNSVNSPAAYFVEILQFLRNNNLHWDTTKWPKSGNPGIQGTALDALFARRPDLGCIELTCENTNTVLPYVDLANEVMESFVVHKRKYAEDLNRPKRATLDVFNIEDETSSELLAEPQHTNYVAYCILKDAVYPIVNAPYHQALDQARILLENMGTSRHQLITTFPTPFSGENGPSPSTEEDRKLLHQHQKTLDRLAASEFWEMSQTEYIAITRESYWSKDFWVIKKKVAISDDEYQAHIGRKPAWIYWGYDSHDDMQSKDTNEKLGLMFVKKQLLQRAYITYEDLVDLVKTRYTNPNMPTGRSRIILESIRFSYQYLMQFVNKDCANLNERYRCLARFLACWKPWARAQGILVDECDTLCLSESEILCWLKVWFEPVGKIIVLESGDVPRLPIEGHLVIHTRVFRPARLILEEPGSQIPPITTPDGESWEDVGKLGRDGIVRGQDGAVVAFVAPDATLRDADGELYVTRLKDLQSLYIISPEVKSFEDEDDIFQNHVIANVHRTTSLITWNIAGGQGDPPTVHYLEATETCNIDNVTIQHLNGTQLTMDEWDRMQAFLRLWRRLGWTINDVDQALSGIAQSLPVSTPDNSDKPDTVDDWSQVIDAGSCICAVCGHASSDCCCKKPTKPEEDCCDIEAPPPPIYITPETVEELVAIKKLSDQSGMDLTQLLTLWFGIPTEGNPSLYSKLFLVHSVSGIDGIFKPDSDGNYLSTPAKISEHIPVILAALRIDSETLETIMTNARLADEITIGTMSTLYRYVVLGRLLAVKPILLPRVIALCGEPFVSPRETLAVTELWQQTRDKGYTLQQMDYLVNDVNDPLKPLGPSKAVVLKATKTMIDGILKINAEHPDIAETETTAAISTNLASKVLLIFDADTTAGILALLSGTTVYSTDAPPNLTIEIPESLKTKLQYTTLTNLTPVRATLSVTGILTFEEASAAKALSSNSGWAAALERIAKRPGRFFDQVLFGIFSDEESAKAILLQGDIPSPPPPTPESSGTTPGVDSEAEQPVDNSTLRTKTVFFTRSFLLFLRKTLADQLIMDTVSGSTSIADPELRILLLTKLIKDTEGRPAIETLRSQVLSPPSYNSSFSGYLIPNATDSFIFVAGGFSSEPPALIIDNQPVRLQNRQDDPSDVWYSEPLALTGGRLYGFTTTGQPASNLQWKTARMPAASIPASALLPGHASDSTKSVFDKLYKAGLVINILGLLTSEVEYIGDNAVDFGSVDFNGFTMDTWKRLADLTTLRESLPQLSLSLIEFFKWVKTSWNPELLSRQISAATGWKESIVTKIVAREGFNLMDPQSFVNEISLIQLQKAVAVQSKIGVDPEQLFRWSRPLSFFWKESRLIAESIRKTLRARYDVSTWEQVAQPLFNKLRANQRDALIAFLLVQKPLKQWGVRDADSLFEFFLIDVQMGSCLQTSRIKQAISSVQLFVQRCLLSLEDEHGLRGFHFDRERWEWMSRYRVWEANRKVFLWPENWIDPTLRDDKSEIFAGLEAQLMQKDLTPAALQEAVKEYLYQVDQVASLRVIGLVIDPETNVLHIFAKTMAAPFSYFYRRYKQYKSIPGDWSPWESMQVDISTYEQEDDKGKTQAVGSYLLPVIWNGRLLAFLPEFNKKTIPVRAESDSTTIQDAANRPLNASMPATYWAIKMGYTEYRQGRWTPKKISTGEVAKLPESPEPPADDGNSNGQPAPAPLPPILPPISGYRFVPKVVGTAPDTNIIVGAFDNSSSDAVGWFEFDGGQVLAIEPPEGKFTISTTSTEFQFTKNFRGLEMHSYQDDPVTSNPLDYISRSPSVLYTSVNPRRPQIRTTDGDEHEFYDPYSHQLLARASTSPTVEGVYNFYRGITDYDGLAAAFGNPVKPATPFGSYHELKTPFAIYNWEIGLHAPMLLVNKLLALQQFDRALEVAHYVFDPFAQRSTPPVPGDLWQFAPFKNVLAESELERTFALLDPNTVVPEGSVIDEWRENPFEPHVVARARHQAYMKWFAVRYIEILIAYGDWYFMQNTLETIPMAIQLYVRASHLYGPRAQRIPRRGKKKVQTYNSLLDQWDGFSNAVVQMELAFPFSQQSDKPTGRLGEKNVLANIFGFATSRYFCVPNNPKLDDVRNLIDDRLYKIRHCQDINGVVRQLPLFEPPIDPGLLVQAAAAGLSFASVVSDLNSPMGNYRFSLLLQKSLELCNELKSMAGMLLSIKEKRDAEALSNLRSRQEVTISGLIMEMKKQALEDANLGLQALRQSRSAPVYRLRYFLQLLDEDMDKVPDEDGDFTEVQNRFETLAEDGGFKLVPTEVMDMTKASNAADRNADIGEIEALSSFLSGLPTTDAQGQPYGMGGSIKFGPQSFAQGAAATARKMRINTETMSAQASNASRMTSFLRQHQDRIQQANSAGYEVKNIDTQLRAQQQKVKIAEQDIVNQQQLMDNAVEVRDFLANKYTNEGLYSWMEDGVSSLYYQTYTLAYQLAKRAERSYAFERGLDASQASFITFGSWDASRAGLLAAERLYVSLKQLEAAHQADRGHDYEIVKHVSLRQLAPLALVQLRELGSCEVTLPEVLFDMDFPGHYQRRIKTVSLTIPCVVGPYTSISCTLRLLSSEVRVSPIGGSAADYPRTAEAEDGRFRTVTSVPVSSIAVSSASNDSGTFELSFRDERYVPFEGAGAVGSRWRIELPTAVRTWDYGTMADVVLHVRYTSREGGERLAAAASGAVREFVRRAEATSRDDGLFAVFDLRSEFAAEWSRVTGPPQRGAEGLKPLALRGMGDRLPVFARVQQQGEARRKVVAQDVWVLLSRGGWVQAVEVLDASGDGTELQPGADSGGMGLFQALGVGIEIGDWVLNLKGTSGERLAKGLVVVRYTIS